MPTKPHTPCCWRTPAPCPKLSADRFCAEHQALYEQRRQKEIDARRNGTEARRKYNRSQWRKLRTMVLAAEPLCRHCKQRGLIVPAAEVDHVIPVTAGGDDSFANLQALCKPCHSYKTASNDGGFGNAKS